MTDDTLPMTDEDREVENFKVWASERGLDIAHAYDSERSRWVFWNPMTADLWDAWKARASLASPAAPHPAQQAGDMVVVSRGALAMVRNALQRDADEGRQIRAEMLRALDEATVAAAPAIPAQQVQPMPLELRQKISDALGPDRSMDRMQFTWLIEHLRSNTNFDAALIEAMLAFAQAAFHGITATIPAQQAGQPEDAARPPSLTVEGRTEEQWCQEAARIGAYDYIEVLDGKRRIRLFTGAWSPEKVGGTVQSLKEQIARHDAAMSTPTAKKGK